jgi:hemerythrin-like domain-containing protein
MKGSSDTFSTRRSFLRQGALVAGAASLTGLATPGAFAAPTSNSKELSEKQQSASPKTGQADVGPIEDLMREHGLLSRILLIYDDAIIQLRLKKMYPPETLSGAADIVRRFVQDYHEKLEEEHIFPRFSKAGDLADLAATLRLQHETGRIVTGEIVQFANAEAMKTDAGRIETAERLSRFVRMYRPHKAREDTVLFPAFHTVVSAAEFDKMGDAFEDKERELFGEGGFEKMVGEVAKLEKAAGLFDLTQFTPRV